MTTRPLPDWEWIHRAACCPDPHNCWDPSGCTADATCKREAWAAELADKAREL